MSAPRKSIGSSKRARIIREADGRCRWCGVDWNLTIDHIIPVCRGGGNEDGNLQVLCRDCNKKKADHYPYNFRTARTVDVLELEAGDS